MYIYNNIFLRSNFKECNPYLLCPTVLYLSSKVEEYPIRLDTILNTYRTELIQLEGPSLLWPIKSIYECEEFVIKLMNYDLMINHPYNNLYRYLNEIDLEKNTYYSVWTVINDMYFSAIPIIYCPDMMILSGIYIIGSYIERDFTSYLNKYNVKMNDIYKITSLLLEVYNRNSKLKQNVLENVLKDLEKMMNKRNEIAIKNHLESNKFSILK